MRKYERDDIFSDIRQVDWYIGGQHLKYPLFFRDMSSLSILFPARISSLKKLLPDIRLSPARILPGVGLISVSVTELSDMGFNHILIAAVLNNPGLAGIPAYNILRQFMQYNSYVYILHQMVSTDNASVLLSGWSDIPIPVVSINLFREPGKIFCNAVQDNELILSMEAKVIPSQRTDLMKLFCHYYENGQPQSWELKMNALKYGFSLTPGDLELKTGTRHPLACRISDILISHRPVLYTHIPCAQAVLYGPEHLHVSTLKHMLQERLGFQVSGQVSYPGMSHERRVHDRNRISLQAEIVGMKQGNRLHEAVQVVNLSKGGMYVESPVPLDEGTEVNANIDAMRFDYTFWAKGKVVRRNRHAMAIEFITSTYDENEDPGLH